MSLPMPANNICDIYRTGGAPPAAPDVQAVPCILIGKGRSSLTTPYYTHIMYVGHDVDIRDGLNAGTIGPGSNFDNVWVPGGGDATSVQYQVCLVRSNAPNSPGACKEVLLLRVSGMNVPWPTDNV